MNISSDNSTKDVKDVESKTESLSKSELTAIGEKYIEIVEMGNGDEMMFLFSNPTEAECRVHALRSAIERIWYGEVDPDKGWIQLKTDPKKYPDSRNPTGYSSREIKDPDGRGIEIYSHSYSEIWLMVAPDGKIKYDSLQRKHPFQVAYLCVRFLNSYYKYHAEKLEEGDEWEPKSQVITERIEDIPQVYQQLKDLGVPLFEFDLTSSERDCEKAMRKIRSWLLKTGREWDISEPHIYVPADLYDSINKRFKLM